MTLLKVNPSHFEEILKKGYSLDLVFMLKMIESQVDVQKLCEENVKFATLYQTLIRKGLISENGDKITLIGVDLLKFMETKDVMKLIKKKPSSTSFEEWWKAFPGTDTFTHKGKMFSGSRSLRTNKEECRVKFEKILMEGEYVAADLTSALEFDVMQKKEMSVKIGTNKLTYMQNSLTYLNQRSYEPFIELIKEGAKIEEAPEITGGTDV